jgi:hypothetical protein
VFPGGIPPAWVSLIARSDGSVDVISNASLPARTRTWLADWLRRYAPREPEASASYVYLALAGLEPSAPPDGQTAEDGVCGVGSGEAFGEPPHASCSTVAKIIDGAIKELGRKQDSPD